MTRETVYRHSQHYTVLWIIAGAVTVISAPAVLGSGGSTPDLGTLALVLVTMLGLPLLLGRLVISVDREAVRWHFGYVGWPGWSQPLSGIATTEVARANVYFGSGIKGGQQHRQYNVTMGGPALRLHLADGRKITLGTPEPQRLQGFIEARLDRSLR